MKIFKRVSFFVIYEIIFCSILGIVLVFHGPFTNIKETYVTSAMRTLNHKYLATMFLSQSEIDKIMAKNTAGNIDTNEDRSKIKIRGDKGNIQIINIKTKRYKGYLMIIDDPRRIKVGTTNDIGQGGMTLSQIVKKYNAVAGINAGGFTDTKMTGTGGEPTGIIIENGEVVHRTNDKKMSIVGFDNDNILVIGNYTQEEIDNLNLRDAISFGPALIVNGNGAIKYGDGGWGIAPRTAIGQRRDGAVLLLTIDGRQADSIGANLKDVQDIMLKYDAYNASNLDGGSSATMYYDGMVINKPSDILGERAIPSAFIVK